MKKVLICGDTIIDEYVSGQVDRISPEAPVLVFDYVETNIILGGACNVAANIGSLLKTEVAIHFHGFVSTIVSDLLTEKNIAIKEINCENDEILLKTRFISNKHQILRVDTNKRYKKSLDTNWEFLKDYDLIVISDYDKNTITSEVFENILKNSTCPILFDVKVWKNVHQVEFLKKENISRVILKCNEKEALKESIRSRWTPLGENLLITLGSRGYEIPGLKLAPSIETNVADVVGAGDVFLAGMAVNYLETGNFNIESMAEFGNLCAAEKVKHFGTWCVERESVEKLKNEIS